jgi:hypothetical protein
MAPLQRATGNKSGSILEHSDMHGQHRVENSCIEKTSTSETPAVLLVVVINVASVMPAGDLM